jgi:hypothetical protein
MKRYSNNKNINNMFKNAIDRNALKKAMQDEKSKKEILSILNKIKY